jgi:probable phosphoglycerate mutase
MSDVLYVVRHGQTALNARGRLRGRVDEPLDATGERQADALGHAFAHVALDGLICSPLLRARQTAQAIVDAHDDLLSTELDEAFTDRDWGPWAGEREADVRARFGSLDRAADVEPAGSFISRVVVAARALMSRRPAPTIMIVAHDAVNRAILARLADDTDDDPMTIPQRLGCWNRVDRRGTRFVASVIDTLPDEGDAR